MKNMDGITKRLNEVEKKSRGRVVTMHVAYKSRADTAAYLLSGNMLKNEPGVYELTWGNEQPASDAQKIKWIRQCKPDQLAEIRREWEASTYERDKIALVELYRLLPTMTQVTAETR